MLMKIQIKQVPYRVNEGFLARAQDGPPHALFMRTAHCVSWIHARARALTRAYGDISYPIKHFIRVLLSQGKKGRTWAIRRRIDHFRR